MSRENIRRVIIVGVLVAAFAIGVQPLLRPDPRPADAPRDVFSADRALADVGEIAREPHPAGSPAMARVADLLSSKLAGWGIETEQQVVRDPGGVTLRNTVARIPGRDPTGAVLFVSHADSVPWGPGAADNATGAAAMLEVARAVTAGPPLRNDLIFLFEDGEEGGEGFEPFAGGRAFAERSPLMGSVKLVVGIDTAAFGAPHVLQTSEENGTLIRGYAGGVDEPAAFGSRAAWEEGSDYETSPFIDAGLPAIEIEDTYSYVEQHTEDDTVEGVEAASLQQLGDQLLGLAGAYGDRDLAGAASPDRAFHAFAVLGLVHYPAAWGMPLAILALLGCATVATISVRRRGLAWRRLLAGIGAALGLVLGVVALSFAAAGLYGALYPNPSPHPVEEYLLSSSAPFTIAAGVVMAVLFGLGYLRLARRLGALELALGFLALWLVAGIAFAALVPIASYVILWPLLAAVAAWIVVLRRPRADLLLLAPAALAVLLLPPMVLLGYFGSGVANLPALGVAPALAAALIATALVGVEPQDGADGGLARRPSD